MLILEASEGKKAGAPVEGSRTAMRCGKCLNCRNGHPQMCLEGARVLHAQPTTSRIVTRYCGCGEPLSGKHRFCGRCKRQRNRETARIRMRRRRESAVTKNGDADP